MNEIRCDGGGKATLRARRNHYHVYVVELSRDVLCEGKFKRCTRITFWANHAFMSA